MAWMINKETLRDLLKMPTGRVYEAYELHRDLPLGTEHVSAVVRVRLDTQKTFGVALYFKSRQKMGFIETRPDVSPLPHEPFGSDDLSVIEADIKDYYAQQRYRVPMEGYKQMMHYVRARIIADALALYYDNQSQCARALGVPRSVFQSHKEKYILPKPSEADTFRVTLKIQDYHSMLEEFERKLLIGALKENENVKPRAAEALRMPRQTLSERLRLLEINV